jgi:hypothetical protein
LLIGKSCGLHIRNSPKFADLLPLPWYGWQGAGQLNDLKPNKNLVFKRSFKRPQPTITLFKGRWVSPLSGLCFFIVQSGTRSFGASAGACLFSRKLYSQTMISACHGLEAFHS